jgi:predicted AAA+ superfamily ATPase
VKTPKVYFTDTGTLCFLAGLRDAAHAAAGPMAGPIFETAVLAELVRTLGARGLDPDVYFWRTATGAEVDFVVDTGAALIPIEVKTSATPRPAMAAGVVTFRNLLGVKAAAGYVVHTGEVRLPLAPGVTSLPFAQL